MIDALDWTLRTSGSNLLDVRRAEEAGLSIPRASRFQAIAGRGVEASVEGNQIAVGGPAMLRERGLTIAVAESCTGGLLMSRYFEERAGGLEAREAMATAPMLGLNPDSVQAQLRSMGRGGFGGRASGATNGTTTGATNGQRSGARQQGGARVTASPGEVELPPQQDGRFQMPDVCLRRADQQRPAGFTSCAEHRTGGCPGKGDQAEDRIQPERPVDPRDDDRPLEQVTSDLLDTWIRPMGTAPVRPRQDVARWRGQAGGRTAPG